MTTDARQQLIHMLKKDLATSPYIGLYHLADWSIHLDTWPELRDSVDANKSKFIKSMLLAFKEDNYGHVESTLNRLQGIGVKWPELDAIKRSYEAMARSWPEDDDDEQLMEAVAARSEFIDGLADLASNGLWLDFQHMLTSTYHDPNDLPQNLKERLHGQFRSMFLTDFEYDARRFVSQKLVSRFDLIPYLDVDKADIAPIVNKYKDGLIKHILKSMKNSTSLEYWATIAAYLYDMGAEWPELQVIYRSLESEVAAQKKTKQLDETDALSARDRRDLEQWVNELIIGFRTKNRGKIEYTLFSILVPNHNNHALLADLSKLLAARLKPQLLEYLHRQLGATDRKQILENIPSVLNILTVLTPSDWPEVPGILDQYKNSFMQYYLSFFKHGDITHYLSDDEFDLLHKFAIDWPELTTLERSYNLEKNTVRNVNESTKPSAEETISDYHNVPLLMVRVLGERGYTVANPAVADVMEKVKPYLIQKILKMFNDEAYKSIPYNVEIIKRVGVNWPEFDVILKSANAEYYKNSNDWYLNESNILEATRPSAEEIIAEYHYYPVMMIHKLIEYGHTVANPAVATVIEKEKPHLIKVLLMLINDGLYKNVPASVAPIKRLGVNWPELDIILKSAKSEQDRLSRDRYIGEGEIPVYRSRTLSQDDYSKIRQISALLHKGAVGDALWVSFEIPSRTNELTQLFEHNKDTIMRFLLKEVQKGTGLHLLEIVLDGLNRQLIAWPEIAIVKRTVYSNEYKGIE